MKTFNKVCVIGLGYIGLPTAAVIASRGIEVLGVDVSTYAVDTINQGKIHIVEPDLDMLVQAAVMTGKLKAATVPDVADAFIIAVPTPFKDDKKPDLSFIEAAVKSIAPILKAGDLIILESTSPVGTTEKISHWLAELRTDLVLPHQDPDNAQLYVAHCPERVLPGRILEELVSNDRIIGGITTQCAAMATTLYMQFVRGECLQTSSRTAEMTKLTENSFRDVNIAFANELSMICDTLKINVWELVKLANRHPRVNILSPGPGVGGHCIAVDPWFIVDSAPEQANIIRLAREINDYKPQYVIEKVIKAADEFKRPIIACLGLAFKADIDDLRESPAVNIAKALKQQKVGEVLVVEPNIKALPASLADLKQNLVSLPEALEKANILLILVDHKQFKSLSLADVARKIVIDTRGIFG
jgi:UDP-N-acetyl-D-mannosaminuronic acid dehydrogenase